MIAVSSLADSIADWLQNQREVKLLFIQLLVPHFAQMAVFFQRRYGGGVALYTSAKGMAQTAV